MLIPFHELFRRHRIQPGGILHLGANTGEEAQAYENLKIKKVIWVEADPRVFRRLVAHVQPYGHRSLRACVWSKDGEKIMFNVANNGGQSSSVLQLGTHKEAHPEVHYKEQIAMDSITVPSLLANHNLKVGPGWLLNIDLQGAELHALRGMESLLPQFDYLYLEVNEKPLYVGCALLPELDAYLDGHGFKRVETKMAGNTGWGDALWVRK